MAHCHEMKTGEVYVCQSCGLEIKVMSSCGDTGVCSCTEPVSCCGQPLTLKA
jgi:hypothetical protein